jgi:hypothetical protein
MDPAVALSCEWTRTIHSLRMNQGIAFARTLRALDADDFRASKLWLLAAVFVLAAWTCWLFAARVPQYESTANVHIESGRALAYFPPDVMVRISVGQPALIHLDNTTLPTRVQAIASDHAELASPANSQLRIADSAEIEISRVSPASIALQSLGLRHR